MGKVDEEKAESQGAPLIVDKRMRRFWVLYDPKDGSMFAQSVSAEFSPPDGHDEVQLYGSHEIASLAADAERISSRLRLEPREVQVFLK